MTAARAESLVAVAPFLDCPHCHESLETTDDTLRCPTGHTFDIARQGYVNLLAGDAHTGTADTAEMVAAREEFLAAGHFEPLTRALASRAVAVAGTGASGCVVDVGAGTGHHLSAVVGGLPGTIGVALDVSKYALRRAARSGPRIGAVACDAWQRLPLRDGVAVLALSVFAPRNAAELWRVLRPGGALLVVAPTQRHLGELRGPLDLLTVDVDKPRRLQERVASHFVRETHETVETNLRLSAADVEHVVMMGPNAFHTDRAALRERIRSLPMPVDVTASVTLSVYRRIGRTPPDHFPQ